MYYGLTIKTSATFGNFSARLHIAGWRCVSGLLLLLLLIKPHKGKSQSVYQDSLRNVINHSSSNKEKLGAFLLLGLDRNSLHADSLKIYITESRKLATILKNEEALMEVLLMEGGMLNKNGESDKAIQLADREIQKKYVQPRLIQKQLKFYLLKGFALNVINKPLEAQETFFTVLAKAESEGEVYVQAAALNGIGWSYHNLRQIDKAIAWYKRGMVRLHSADINNRLNKDLMTVLHSNIGLAYYPLYKESGNKEFADSANLYLDSAIRVCREEGFIGVLAISLGTKALLVQENGGSQASAVNTLKEAIGIRKGLGQLYFIISDMTKLSEMYYRSGDYSTSISASREAIRLADSSGIKSDIIELYETLAKSYRAAGFYKEYGDVLAVQIRVRDSISKANTESSLNELTVKYELQKKEVLIAKQEYNLLRRKILLYVIIFVAAAGLLFFVISFLRLKKQQRQKMERLKAAEETRLLIENKMAREGERERIIADLHDDVGATLSSMNIYGELANKIWYEKPEESKQMVEKISASSKDLMDRMGDIIWSMKPAGIEKYTLETRLKNYCLELLTPKNILCEFEVDEKLAGSVTNPEVRKNLLLIAKEAINNIAKYSNATKAVLSFREQQQQIILAISDNGKGMDLEKIKYGNGLQNMEQRCKFLQGVFTIESPAAGGTKLTCSFPMAIISHSPGTGNN